MSEKISEKRCTSVHTDRTNLVLEHLNHLLQVQLATLPDVSFKTTRFIPSGKGGFVTIYSRRYYPKLGQLFDRVEVVLAGKGVKRVVFMGSLPLADTGPLSLLIEDLVTIAGKDLFKKRGFTIRDKACLKRGSWAGRRWLLCFDGGKRLPLVVDLMQSQLQLCLYLPF